MKRLFIIIITVLCFVTCAYSQAFASSLKDAEQLEYSEEYKKYLELSEEEKENVCVPLMFDYKEEKYEKNVFETVKSILLKGVEIPTEYSLKSDDVISNIITVKDQGETNTCWAFAFAGAAEATLGLQDFKQGITSNTYDFSERHLEYGITRDCLNNEINKVGIVRNLNTGGNFTLAEMYCLKGLGLVNENDMPFRDNDGNIIPLEPIALSEITNKEARTQLRDTTYFEKVSAGDDHTEVMAKMKEHIMTHGGLVAQIRGDDRNNGFIDLETGTIFVDAESANGILPDHEVQIIGWNDNYPAANFKNDKLTKNGAWIIKNSWGDNFSFGTLNEYKLTLRKQLFDQYISIFMEKGIYTEEGLTDEILLNLFNAMYEDEGKSFATLSEALIEFSEDNGFTYDRENDEVYMKIGDNGLFYVSYEDAFVYTGVKGIENITMGKEYDNVHTYLDYSYNMAYDLKTTYELDTVFKASKDEYIKDVGLFLYSDADVYVYVNPSSDSLDDSKFQAIKLKAGNYESSYIGYHTFEFERPLKISSGSNYVVRLKVVPKGSKNILLLEGKDSTVQAQYTTIESNKCFVKYGGTRYELGLDPEVEADSTVFVHTSNIDDSVNRLVIDPGPTKTTYYEGEDFDPTGMKVYLEKGNGQRTEVTNYTLSNNKKLKLGQTKVTIVYGEYSVDQKITVKQNSVVRLEKISDPTKTEYKAGYDFDPSGLRIKAIYENGEEKEVTDFEIPDKNDLTDDQISVTVSYGGKTLSIPITVEENPLVSLTLKKNPTKTEYVEGQKFNPEGMEIEAKFEDGLTKTITSYKITNGDSLSVEQNTIEITYGGKSVTVEITVVEKKAVKIEISKMPKVEYEVGEKLDLTDGKLTITYNDESTETISLDSEDVEVSGFSSETPGNITLEVKYLKLTTTLTVKINELKLPENSNFDNAKYTKGVATVYTYDKIQKDDVVNFEGTISSIVEATVNDSAKYYVYVGTESDERDINDWTYIGENKIENGNLNFKVTLTGQSNVEKLKNASTCFIYIKEVATRGSQEKVLITKGIQFNNDTTDLIMYLDDVEYFNSKTNKFNGEDPTTANGVLPQTGEIAVLSAVAFVLVIAAFEYRKLKKYKDIK